MEITKSIIIPCKDEEDNINNVLHGIFKSLKEDTEVIVVVDDVKDSTIKNLSYNTENLRTMINDYGPGPANAIKYGIENSLGDSICVFMGDGSDDPDQIEELFSLINRGVSVAVATRYSRGGQYVGNSTLKYLLSRLSGVILYYLFFIKTKDPTNMFKAYDKSFLNSVEIESKNGFTLGLEMVVKAKLQKKRIAEIPTIWIDRDFGESKFSISKFLPSYLYWVFRLIIRKK